MNDSARCPECSQPFLLTLPTFAASNESDKPPLALGRLCGPLRWHWDRDGNQCEDVAECDIEILCPFCRGRHVHGWRLDGCRRTEQRRAHCGCGLDYRIRPASTRDVKHDRSPTERVGRPTRLRRPPRPSITGGLPSLEWLRRQRLEQES